MIIGMLRIKDEARWIKDVLRSMLPACDRIFILDDHSSDDTVRICKSFPAVEMFLSPFDGFSETRDKNYLIEQVETVAKSGDFVLAIDGDEEITAGGAEQLQRLAKHNLADAYSFQVLYLWDRLDQIRVDRVYANFWRPSFFKLRPGARFQSSAGGGFHCGNVPGLQHAAKCDVKILHMGYMHREDRIRKWAFYNEHDPHNRQEGYDPRFPERKNYPHIVQGDVPEVPADAVLMHAGPLEVRPL